MGKETVYDLVENFAKQKSREPGVFHFLCGYAQLLSLNKVIVENILEDSENKSEFERIEQIAEKRGLDVKLMKQGIPFLLAEYKEEDDIEKLIEEAKSKRTNENGDVPADILFELILDSKKMVSDLFRKGSTVEDVIEYVTKQKGEKEEEPKKEKETEKKEDKKEAEKAEEKVSDEKEEPDADGTQDKFGDLAVKCRNLYDTLKEFIHGQDDAISIFVNGYFKAELMSNVAKEKTSPRAIFLFAGPPGVGKTYLATTAADVLKMPVKRFNMSEYSDHQSPTELIGLSKKYNGSTRGLLTSFVKKNPKSVLIFDEVEKAHLNVIHLFLQILDAGTLKDNFDEENVSFEDTIIIFTTNVGKKLYEDNRDQNLSLLSHSVVLDALGQEKHPLTGNALFPAAICSRFATGNVVMFNHLKCSHLLNIVDKNFLQCAKQIEEKYKYHLNFDKNMSSLFLYHMSSNLDARVVSSQSSQFIQGELYEFSRQAADVVDFSNLSEIEFSVKLPDEQKVRDLFVRKGKDNIVLLGSQETADRLSPLGITVHVADTFEKAESFIAQYDNRILLIDPMFGYKKDDRQQVFSLEDYDTEGIRCFNAIRTAMPQMPIYILETDNAMRSVDKNTFQQQGARGVLSALEDDSIGLCHQVDEVLEIVYLQSQVEQLAKQEKVLNFSTAQSISADKTKATIEFYDFKLQTAVKADNKNVVLSDLEKPDIKFDDVIGAENAKKELRFFIQYLKSPKEFMLKGVKPPKGILLYGPPGTGKTMLAKAMAGEADVTFLPTTATNFMDKYMGEGENRIRKLFATAKKYAPSVIFIDEIDAIGKERKGDGSGRFIESLLNTLLTEMDGFSVDPKYPVFVMAATNFPLSKEEAQGKAVIDPALLRRFANKVYVDLPNEEERELFIRKTFERMGVTDVSDDAIKNIAERTTGESLANLHNLIDFAVRAKEREGEKLDSASFLSAAEEFFYGEEHKWGRSYYEGVAYHESGHAYVSYLSGKKPAFMTIVSRGNFGGYMQSENSEKVPNYTKEDLLWRIRVSLAGRASEMVFFGEEKGINTGVSSDLEHATNLALQMICRYGMDGTTLLSISPERIMDSVYGEKILLQADKLLNEQLEKTLEIIRDGKDKVKSLADKLLEKNQLMGTEIEEILS